MLPEMVAVRADVDAEPGLLARIMIAAPVATTRGPVVISRRARSVFIAEPVAPLLVEALLQRGSAGKGCADDAATWLVLVAPETGGGIEAIFLSISHARGSRFAVARLP